MYGASTNRPTSFFLSPVSWWKQFTRSSSLYLLLFSCSPWNKYCGSCCFRSPQSFSNEKTSRFVVEKTLPTPSMWSKQSVSCSDATYSSVLLPAHSGDPTYRQTLNHNLLVEEPELNLLVFACKQHWLRLTIGEPEKSTSLARFPNLSYVWSTRLDQAVKKILSDPRKLREEPVEEAINREGEPEFGKGFSSHCVHVYARNQGRYYCLEPIWRHHLQALLMWTTGHTVWDSEIDCLTSWITLHKRIPGDLIQSMNVYQVI